jgi:hypothetical protein
MAMPSYSEGRAARINGLPIGANPYLAGTPMHANWAEGWRDSDTMLRALEPYNERSN